MIVREKEIPLKPEPFPVQDDNEFFIHSSKEIQLILNTIYKRTTRAALYYDQENFSLTMLLGSNEEGIWLDPPSKPQVTRDILNSDNIVFVSSHNQTKVQFAASEAYRCIYHDKEAIFLLQPSKLLRLQRRNFFRMDTQVGRPLKCVFKPMLKLKRTQQEASIMDISVGGFSMISPETSLNLSPGVTFPNCEVKLPDIGTLNTTIEVRNEKKIFTANGKRLRRIGCAFVKPDADTYNLLQRYVTHMQQ